MLRRAPRPSTKRIDPHRMKAMNAASLLSLLQELGPLGRADLARLSRLSKPTVSEQIADLISRGLVIETGHRKPTSKRGKKLTLLEFNEDCGRVIAARISSTQVRAWEAKLDGAVLREVCLPVEPRFGPKYVIDALRDAIGPILASADVPPQRRLISVSTPGIVDADNGIVLETDNIFGWRNVSLAATLHREFGVPVCVDNDVNLAVLAEARFGAGRGQKSFALIHLDTGLGLGVFLNGAPYHGQHWAAGEIAHMVPNASDIGIPTGGRGHLESAVALDCVSEQVRKLAADSSGPLATLLEKQQPVQALLAAASQGQESAVRYVSKIVEILAAAIVNVSACYDPARIILVGPLFSLLFDRIRPVFESVIRWPVELQLSTLGEDAFLRGALAAGLSRLFSALEVELETTASGSAAQKVMERGPEALNV
ncbi:MAG: ROK family protein [Bryobacterales bacterium]|nr:ROK family protein [Bryobacterales bacterium]